MVFSFSEEDSKFLAHLRALSIFIIVFGHVGGFWIFGPASKFLLVFLSSFFFISGVVSFVSINKYSSLLRWMLRRFISLYLPYLLFCLFPIGFYLFVHRSFSLYALLSWLKMHPAASYTSYPVGHLWFIQTLMIITVFMAPLMFLLFQKNSFAPWLYLIFVSLLAFFKFSGFISNEIYFLGFPLYKPFVYSLFYVLGWFFLLNKRLFFSSLFLIIIFLLFSLCLFSSIQKHHSFYFEGHIHPPDIYFILGSILAIIFFVRVKDYFNKFFSFSLLKNFSKFFFDHTYAIYLWHTFAIFLAETIFAFLLPSSKNLTYGVIKLIIVLALTCIFSFVFDLFAKRLIRYLFTYFKL